MIECLKETEMEKLKHEICMQPKLKPLKPRAPKVKLPKIIIYGLDQELSKEEFWENNWAE